MEYLIRRPFDEENTELKSIILMVKHKSTNKVIFKTEIFKVKPDEKLEILVHGVYIDK